ncbi:hypothetical protein BUALT_Bualt18G0067400 [Buddleja alternifolia]|uniref:RING-type domain-containing protein n=1 Tax=Buddleja alternifolia TaxID=168488 RepID=A0AAV6W3V2_9LAMI|nr:hypothetical protein BUALT_Bualt18G0067400 [Buddleja alternifolia]
MVEIDVHIPAAFDPFADAKDSGGAGAKDYVHIRIQQRNGKKSLTTVQGLRKEFSYEKILKDLKKEFCCNGNVVQDKELGEVIQLQGDQRKNVSQFLSNAGIVKKDQIKIHEMLMDYLSGFPSWLAFKVVIDKLALALLICILALGGAIIGSVTGAIKGQTTETGLLRGIGVGAVTGAITGVQLLELVQNGESFSKFALICSLLNGKIFMEWVSPAVLKAYQWQISAVESNLREMSDIFEVGNVAGLSQDTIKELPVYTFSNAETSTSCTETSCAICLQDLKDGESARLLPSCRHFFHLQCINEWLTRQGTCPICRKDV